MTREQAPTLGEMLEPVPPKVERPRPTGNYVFQFPMSPATKAKYLAKAAERGCSLADVVQDSATPPHEAEFLGDDAQGRSWVVLRIATK